MNNLTNEQIKAILAGAPDGVRCVKNILCGVAYRDLPISTHKPYYEKWKSMITRCYSAKTHARQSFYGSCVVCDEWLIFSNFVNWVDSQPVKGWRECHLDKDILHSGNKEYAPDKCLFVSQAVNNFLVNFNNAKGFYYHKPRKKYKAQCRNPFTDKNEQIGYFSTEQEAHNAWLKRKREIGSQLCMSIKDERVSRAIADRIGIKVPQPPKGASDV